MEVALRISEESYRILVETTQDSIYTVDKEAKYLFMNEHHKKRLRIAGEDYRERKYGDFHAADDTNRFSEYIQEVADTKKPVKTGIPGTARHFSGKCTQFLINPDAT